MNQYRTLCTGDNTYAIWDNLRACYVVKDETFMVCDAIENALRYGANGTTEADEVANRILSQGGSRETH